MKKLLAMLMATAMVACLATGCGNKTNPVPDEDDVEVQAEDSENTSETENQQGTKEITDFSADISVIDENDIDADTAVNIDNGSSYYQISFNHMDDIEEINFYRSTKNAILNHDADINAREYIATYYGYYPLDKTSIRYDLPKDGPNLIVSFLAKNSQVFEFYVSEDMKLINLGTINSDDLIQYVD